MAHILLTIDVEDWFQVENFKPWIPFSSWSSCEVRVEKNTHRLLDLFDSFDGQRTTDNGQNKKVRATFFILGWLAERLPNLVREIHARGYEVGSHGYYHNLCYKDCQEDLRRDLSDSKSLLEDITGSPVNGYRAPNFSITNDVLEMVKECGYLYDSSYNSFGIHGRYGKIDLPTNAKMGIAIPNPVSINHPPAPSIQHPVSSNQSPSFYELPISNLKLGNRIIPWGGGGYFRLIPFQIFKVGVQHILDVDNAYVLYLHPWEIDPDQPRVKEAKGLFKFRHYINLSKTYLRLSKFIQDLTHHQFVTCSDYLHLASFIRKPAKATINPENPVYILPNKHK